MTKKISNATPHRYPIYLKALKKIQKDGKDKIMSNELAKYVNIKSTTIRRDFSLIGTLGKQGYGYNVNYLYSEIANILGLNEEHNLIIIGAGHLGQALVNYMNFERRGFLFKGMFDNNPALYGKKIRDMQVRPMEEI